MNVPIAMICDTNYIAAAGVAISSIISSKQSSTSYTIYMLCASLSAEQETMFRSFESDTVSIIILRVDANYFTSLAKINEGSTCPASPSALLKFGLPNILNNEDKVLYLDVDIIVRTDLTKLYSTPLDNNLVAAVIDSSSIYNKKYQCVDDYFNSGVMLLNLKLMREENTIDAFIEAKLDHPIAYIMDQTAYNYVCDGRVKFLPIRYNLLCVILDRARDSWTVDDINNRYGTSYTFPDEIFDSAVIIHFASDKKPWIYPSVRYAQDWYDIYYSLPSCFHTVPDYAELLSQTTPPLGVRPKSSPCISVIVAVYNTQSYLAECIDSILSQTLNDIEVICVDDGSADGSSDILEKYAVQDSRMHIVHQSHQHAGVARNTGLAMAQGEYVIFLDSDDFFAPEMLDHIYKSARENKSDIVLFNGCRYDDKKRETVKSGVCLNTGLLPEQKTFSWCDVPNYIFNISDSASWNKLFARHFLLENGLHFSNQPNAEDVCFTLLSLALAQRISAVCEDLIYYRVNRPDSLQYTDYEQPLCILTEYETLYQNLIQRNLYIPLQASFRNRALESILSHLINVRTNQARIQLLDALDNEPYCNLPLKEIPEKDDGNNRVHKLSLQLTAAQAQYHSSLDALTMTEHFNKLPQASKADTSIKVSVVIPVYNTQAYLDEALASIAKQTLKNIEIICINDGSTDDSLDILNRWAADDRFIVISQPNMGLSYTRNIGITRARGEYLYFMDSDDLLELDALEQLTAIMDEKQLDSLHFDAETFFDSAELEENHPDFRDQFTRHHSFDEVYDGPSLMRLLCEAGEYQPPVWLQINRLDFIQAHNIRMPIGILHEDNVFTFTAMLFAQRTSHIQRPYYRRRIRTNSIMTKDSSFQNVYGLYRSFWEMLQIYLEISPDIDEINHAGALNRIATILEIAHWQYSVLNDEEKYGRLGLIEDLSLFNALIGEPGNSKANVRHLNNKVSDLTAKLKEANAKRAEFFAQRNKLREEKEVISQSFQVANQEKADRDALIAELKKAIGEQQTEIEAIQNSWTYRIGRFFTWPVRKMRAIRNHST